MANLGIKLTLDPKEERELKRYLRLVKRNVGNTRPVMVAAVGIMAKSVIANFREAGREPFKWPPLAASTIKQRQREGTWSTGPLSQPILMRYGALLQSFQVGKAGNYNKVEKDSAEYGTTLVKARGLQFGRPEISLPPRPMIYWRDEDVRRIMSYAHAFAFQPEVAAKFRNAPNVGTIPANLFQGVG